MKALGRMLGKALRRMPRLAGGTFLLLLVEWIVFKIYWPQADHAGTPGFETGALAGVHVLWPVGYSWFLRLFHVFTYSETVLVSFQYLVLELSALYFFGMIRDVFGPGGRSSILLYLFLFVNPLFPCLANVTGGDALFAAISLLWITQLCRMLHKQKQEQAHEPRLHYIITLALLMGMAFSLTYSALCYLPVTVAAFFYADYRFRTTLFGVVLSVLVVASLINRAAYFDRKITGFREFQILDGRQAAHDILHMYPYIRVDSNGLPNRRLLPLNRLVRDYAAGGGVNDPDSLIKRYSDDVDENEYNPARVAALFSAYGAYLVKSHRSAYIWYCFLPDSKGYFFPGSGRSAGPLASPAAGLNAWVVHPSLRWLPSLFFACNIFYLCVFLGFFAQKGYRHVKKDFTVSMVLVAFLLVLNVCFSVYAAPVVWEDQVFAMVLEVAFGLSMIDYRGQGWLDNYRDYLYFERDKEERLDDVWEKIGKNESGQPD